jgi:putative lipoprotein
MRFRALLVLLGLIYFAGCASDEIPPELEDPARVSGTITYAQRVALPDDAVLRISLFAMVQPGSPGTLVNEETIAAPGQVPIPFEMWYRRDTIDPHRIYALRARIEAGGKIWFVNNELVPVITNGAYRNVRIILDIVPS